MTKPLEQRPTNASAPQPLSILVVDDDDSMRDILTSLLKSKYPVTAVSSGEDALKTIELKHIDL
jgi:CheY-like chemotaxis protein